MFQRRLPFLLFLFLFGTTAFSGQPLLSGSDDHPEWGAYFREFGVSGGFVLYDLKNDRYSFYNQPLSRKRYIPASTFKIPNSIVALETGEAADENFLLKWDGVDRGSDGWNRDHTLASAFKVSAVWYYQEMARRVGQKRMKQMLHRLDYGNENTGGGIDRFWLSGKLRISPMEQIDFLRRLHAGTLSVSKRSIDLVKKIMIGEQTESYTLRGKTGWAQLPGGDTGWYVGYLERGDNVYFFALVLPDNKPGNPEFVRSRAEITRRILKEKGLM